jgi:hypothetical protein
MKLIILCVDGFDPEYAEAHGFDKFRYSGQLDIPEECFIESPDGPQPTTGRVWPTIFSGKVHAHSLIERKGARKWAHDWLLSRGISWTRGRPSYQVNPWNERLDTVFTGRLAYTWNLPTISPEWIVRFPDMARLMEYCRREFSTYELISRGLASLGPYELGAVYTRIVDAWGHFKKAEDMEFIYSEVSAEAWRLGEIQRGRGDELLLLSDHGCLNGVHTDKAYIGATFPFEASNILDVRGVIEGVLK